MSTSAHTPFPMQVEHVGSVMLRLDLDPLSSGIFYEGDALQVPGEHIAAVEAVLAVPGWGEPPVEARLAIYQRAIEAHVEATARARGYKSDVSCASHTASTNPLWKAEAEAFVAWRDAVWTAVFATFAAVQAGEVLAPTVEALVEGLPSIEWPVAA